MIHRNETPAFHSFILCKLLYSLPSSVERHFSQVTHSLDTQEAANHPVEIIIKFIYLFIFEIVEKPVPDTQICMVKGRGDEAHNGSISHLLNKKIIFLHTFCFVFSCNPTSKVQSLNLKLHGAQCNWTQL